MIKTDPEEIRISDSNPKLNQANQTKPSTGEPSINELIKRFSGFNEAMRRSIPSGEDKSKIFYNDENGNSFCLLLDIYEPTLKALQEHQKCPKLSPEVVEFALVAEQLWKDFYLKFDAWNEIAALAKIKAANAKKEDETFERKTI